MRCESHRNRSASKQDRKFHTLLNAQKPIQDKRTLQKKSNVVNLSRTVLNENEIKVLEYGLNFAIAPAKIPTK